MTKYLEPDEARDLRIKATKEHRQVSSKRDFGRKLSGRPRDWLNGMIYSYMRLGAQFHFRFFVTGFCFPHGLIERRFRSEFCCDNKWPNNPHIAPNLPFHCAWQVLKIINEKAIALSN